MRATPRIGVFYLAWGRLADPVTPFETFLESYLRRDAGVEHQLYIICKGFTSNDDLRRLSEKTKAAPHALVYVDERELDIGAYYAAAMQCECDVVCFLNTYSEILGEWWLAKLSRNLARPSVGLVGCSGSYEAPTHGGRYDNIPFPSPHLRSNAFMLGRDVFLKIKPRHSLNDKFSTYIFEHGRMSLTRRIVSLGLDVLVVGKDGRGYSVNEWSRSRTFRQGGQTNLLIGDNRTRDFDLAPAPEKRSLFRMAWSDRSNGLLKLVEAEDVEVYDLVAVAYQTLLRRSPTMEEYEDGAGIISSSADGGEYLLQQIVSTEEFMASGNIAPSFITMVEDKKLLQTTPTSSLSDLMLGGSVGSTLES